MTTAAEDAGARAGEREGQRVGGLISSAFLVATGFTLGTHHEAHTAWGYAIVSGAAFGLLSLAVATVIEYGVLPLTRATLRLRS